MAARVFESTVPSLTVTLNAGATSSPSSTNSTRLAPNWALVKLVIATPGLLLSWKIPPLTPLTV